MTDHTRYSLLHECHTCGLFASGDICYAYPDCRHEWHDVYFCCRKHLLAWLKTEEGKSVINRDGEG